MFPKEGRGENPFRGGHGDKPQKGGRKRRMIGREEEEVEKKSLLE